MYSGPVLRNYAEAVAHEAKVKPMQAGSSYSGYKPLGARKKPFIQIGLGTNGEVRVGYLSSSSNPHTAQFPYVEYHVDGRIQLNPPRWNSDLEVMQGVTGISMEPYGRQLWVHDVFGTTWKRGSYRLTAGPNILRHGTGAYAGTMQVEVDNLLTQHVVDRKRIAKVREPYAEFRRFMKNTLNVCEGHLHDLKIDNVFTQEKIGINEDYLRLITEGDEPMKTLHALARLTFRSMGYWKQHEMKSSMGHIIVTYAQADAVLQEMIKRVYAAEVFVPRLAKVGVMCKDPNAGYI